MPPGATATFTFALRGPPTPGTCVLPLRPVVEGITWLEEEGIHIVSTVLP